MDIKEKTIKMREGFPHKGDPVLVYAKIRELMKKNNGFVTADIVLNEARKKSSILHKEFEWDDSKAAHLYRKQQAYSLITATRIYKPELTIPLVRTVIGIKTPGEKRRYYSEKQVREDVDLNFLAKKDCLKAVASFVEKWQHITDGQFGELMSHLSEFYEKNRKQYNA